MGVAPAFRVKVISLIVAGFIARLKLAVSSWVVATPVDPLPGIVERTVGCAGATWPVVKLQVKLAARLVPVAALFAPVPMVAVRVASEGSAAVGSNVAVMPA